MCAAWLQSRVVRRLGAWSALLAAVLLGVRLLVVQGFVRPVRVVSGSMAPALLGPHFQIACRDCGYPVLIDAAQADKDEPVVCSNCGYAKNDLSQAALHTGERVLIDRGAFGLRRPRRFQTVAFIEPHEPRRLVVKRIVGLPGERVEIRGGDLFVNDRLARKSWEELREMAVVVHDDRFRPGNAGLPSRWRSESGRWTESAAGYHYSGDLQPFTTAPTRSQFTWLTYHHWRCSPLPGLRTKESPVLDDYGYNLGPSRTLNPVTDVLLQCHVQTEGEGCLAVSLHDGRQTWEVRVWPQRGRAVVVRAGEEVAAGAFARQDQGESFLLEVALCDRQVLAAINERPLVRHAYEVAPAPRRPTSTPIALGALGLAVEVREILVARDVFHLPPPGRGKWSLDQPLDDAHYVVLGDNAPIAQDSRVWATPALPRNALLGPVFRWPGVQPMRGGSVLVGGKLQIEQ